MTLPESRRTPAEHWLFVLDHRPLFFLSNGRC